MRPLTLWKNAAATLTAPFLSALLLGAGFLAFVAWDQSHWWQIKEDYHFGWLVPVMAGYVVHIRWAEVQAALAACAREGSLRASGWQKWLLRVVVSSMLLFGALMFLLGSFYRAGAGTSQPGTLAITLGAVAIVLPLLLVNAPESPAPAVGNIFADARVQLVILFTFPVLVWLVSAPLVSAIETQVNLFLLHKVVGVVAFVFVDVLGLPIEQQGNVLVLPTGSVGVEDACSGIHSLTASLFAGSFLAAVSLDRLRKKIALVVSSCGLVFGANLARSLFLTGWAYHRGPRAIEGTVHDVAGYAVMALTFVGLLGLVWLFNLKLLPRGAHPVAEAQS